MASFTDFQQGETFTATREEWVAFGGLGSYYLMVGAAMVKIDTASDTAEEWRIEAVDADTGLLTIQCHRRGKGERLAYPDRR